MLSNRIKSKSVEIRPWEVDMNVLDSDSEKDDQTESLLGKFSNNIGTIIINFNLLEFEIIQILKFYITESQYTAAVVLNLINEKSFSQRIDILKLFYNNYSNSFFPADLRPEIEIKINQVVDKLKSIAGIRNKYAHSFWHTVDDKHFVQIKSELKKDGTIVNYIRFNEMDLIEDLNELFSTHDLLNTFNKEFYDMYAEFDHDINA